MLDSPYRAPEQDFHLRSQRPCQAHPSSPTSRWSSRPAAASSAGAAPFVLVSNIPAFSVLALKVTDSSMVSVSPDVDREGSSRPLMLDSRRKCGSALRMICSCPWGSQGPSKGDRRDSFVYAHRRPSRRYRSRCQPPRSGNRYPTAQIGAPILRAPGGSAMPAAAQLVVWRGEDATGKDDVQRSPSRGRETPALR